MTVNHSGRSARRRKWQIFNENCARSALRLAALGGGFQLSQGWEWTGSASSYRADAWIFVVTSGARHSLPVDLPRSVVRTRFLLMSQDITRVAHLPK
jgi:hypothetical protein